MAAELLEVLDGVREQHFKGRKKRYPYSEWERRREIVKQRLRALPAYVAQAVAAIRVFKRAKGRPQKAALEKKVLLFLLTRLLAKSNRGMEELLELFGPLFNLNVSYKYIERLYADEEVQMALHNLFVLLVREGEPSGHFVSDGSGYSLTIHRIYRSNPRKCGRAYRYVSRILDIETGMYVAYGWSPISEMQAFKQAIAMLTELDIGISSLALDKYYSSRRVVTLFGRTVSLYLIPKRNMTHIGLRWADVFRRIMEDPVAFLSRYFMRNLSESGYSADKRRWGGVVRQRREDRQDAALGSIAVLHNLYAFRVRT
jgi:transposase